MRAFGVGFGLIALLLGVGLMMYLSAENAAVVVPAGNKARQEAEQMAGVANNIRATDSAVFSEQRSGSRVTALVVSSIVPGGPMANYGLQKDDAIVQVGPFTVADAMDLETVKAMVYEAPQRLLPITLLRNGTRVTLSGEGTPLGAAVGLGAAPAPGAAPAAQPAKPAPQQPANGLQGQLDLIKNAGQ